MAPLMVALVLLAFASAAEASSENADADTCAQQKELDAAALLQGTVAVQHMTGTLAAEKDMPRQTEEVKLMKIKSEPMKKAPRFGKGQPVEIKNINIEFGGDSHGVNSKEGYLMRPEAVKSKACDSTGCQDCSSPASCFHGKTEGGWGIINLAVAAGSLFTHYTAEVWARCSSGPGAWWLEVLEVTNGKLSIFADNQEVAMKGKWAELPIKGNQDGRVRAAFHPTDRTKASSAKIWLEAFKVDKSVDNCMGAKECLDVLGGGGDAAFELRNGNEKQLKCLLGDTQAMSSALRQMCTNWEVCVSKSGKKPHLLALLRAAFAPRPGAALIEGVSAGNQTRRTDSCVEPAVDDPESWDCECAEEMLAQCQGSNSLESCVQDLMCKHSNVCCSWKQNHCPLPVNCQTSLADSTALMSERSQGNTKSAMINDLDNHLDGAVQGKCAE